MIKILFFIDRMGRGGAEKVLRSLVNHMDQSRFDITVQTLWPYDGDQLLAPGVKIRSVYPVKNKATEFLCRFEAALGLTYPLRMKSDYDIECAFLEFGPTKILASSTNKRAKKIAWVHCDLSHALVEYAHTSYEDFARKTISWYRKYDRVVCVSQSAKNSFDQIFHSAFRSDVLYNAVDDDMIREKAEVEVPDLVKRKLTILAVGTIYPPKNYPRLIAAHKKILDEGFDHELWIIGDGQDRKQLESLIGEMKLNDSVRLYGFQKNPYPYIKKADVLACSSNYEGFSTVISEGIILGKAIVTTDCSGMREILGNSEYGLIVENSDEAFYQGLRKMIIDKKLRDHFETKAFQRAPFFSLKRRIKETEQFFEQLTS